MSGFKSFDQSTLKSVPKEPGIYMVRAEKPFCRLRGETDILYIGMAGRDLRRRLSTFWRANGRNAKIRFETLKKAGFALHYSYYPCANPREEERLALARFARKHLELPPLNHSE